MATRQWLGDAIAVKNVQTLTMTGTWVNGDDITLTINGKPPHPSNNKLLEQVEGKKETYMDIAEVTTDNSGAVDKEFRAKLSPGDYDVKFLVKDRTDWKVVLYTNLLTFNVK